MGANAGKQALSGNGSMDSSRNGLHTLEFSNHLNGNTEQDHSGDRTGSTPFVLSSENCSSSLSVKPVMVVLYDFTGSMKSQISIKRGELVSLLGYSPAGDWSEVEAGDLTNQAPGVPGIMFPTSAESRYRRGWVPTSYLATANMLTKNSYNPFLPQVPVTQTSGTCADPRLRTSVDSPISAHSTDRSNSSGNPVSFPIIGIQPGSLQSSERNHSPVSIQGPNLSSYPWYHGAVSRQAGEQLLRVGITGSFLVRASESSPGQLSVTVRHLGRVYHYRINQDIRGLFFITNVHRFPTVVQLIEHHSKSADGLVCPLLHPVPRQQQVCSKPMLQTSYPSVTPQPPSVFHTQPMVADPVSGRSTVLPSADMVGRSSTAPTILSVPAAATPRAADLPSPFALDGWEVNRNEIIMCQKLGAGQYGDVYEAIWKRHNTVVAVKTLKQDVSLNVNDFLKEASIMKKLRHRNLVQLLGVCTREPPLYLITEYMPYGNLLNYLRGRSPGDLPPPVLLYMAVQIASGMSYLEANSFIHRDLAARNCLVGERNLIKVADFGLARYMQRQDKTYTARNGAKFPIKWTAPEGLAYYLFSSKSDVWAFGVVLWELATYGLSPYPGVELHDVYHLLERGYRMERPRGCPEAIYAIMLRCWEWESNRRPSFREIHAELDQMCYTLNIDAEVARELENQQLPMHHGNPTRPSNHTVQPTRGPQIQAPMMPPTSIEPPRVIHVPSIKHTRPPVLIRSTDHFDSDEDELLSADEDIPDASDEDEDAAPVAPQRRLVVTCEEPRKSELTSHLIGSSEVSESANFKKIPVDTAHIQGSLRVMSLGPIPTPAATQIRLMDPQSNTPVPVPPHRTRLPFNPMSQAVPPQSESSSPYLRLGPDQPRVNGRSAARLNYRSSFSEVGTQNGTTKSRDTDTLDESGVGESIVSNDSPVDSGGATVVVISTVSQPQNNLLPPTPSSLAVQVPNSPTRSHVYPDNATPISHDHQTPHSSPDEPCHPTSSTQQLLHMTCSTQSGPMLRLSAESVDRFATIPPHDRVGQYLESLTQLDTTPKTPTETAEVNINQNQFLVFLNYPPPPPPPVHSPTEDIQVVACTADCVNALPVVQFSLPTSTEVTTLSSSHVLETTKDQTLATEVLTAVNEDVEPSSVRSTRSRDSDTVNRPDTAESPSAAAGPPPVSHTSCSDSTDDLDDVYQAPDACYSMTPNLAENYENTLVHIKSLVDTATQLRQGVISSSNNTLPDTLHVELKQLTDSVLLLNSDLIYLSCLELCSHASDQLNQLYSELMAELQAVTAKSQTTNLSSLLNDLLDILHLLIERMIAFKNPNSGAPSTDSSISPLTAPSPPPPPPVCNVVTSGSA